jgi:acetyl esterase/lipase
MTYQLDPEIAAALSAAAGGAAGRAAPIRGDWKELRRYMTAVQVQMLSGSLPAPDVRIESFNVKHLAAAGVPLELHVHPGAPHGYDRAAPHAQLSRRALADRMRVLRAL